MTNNFFFIFIFHIFSSILVLNVHQKMGQKITNVEVMSVHPSTCLSSGTFQQHFMKLVSGSRQIYIWSTDPT